MLRTWGARGEGARGADARAPRGSGLGARVGVLGGHFGVTAGQGNTEHVLLTGSQGPGVRKDGVGGGRARKSRGHAGEAGSQTEPDPGPPASSPPRAPQRRLTSSGLLRMAAVAAQSRFSSPAGTRPAGKLVSSSTNGMSSGKGANGRRGETRRRVRVCVPEGRATGSGGGAPRKPALLIGWTETQRPLIGCLGYIPPGLSREPPPGLALISGSVVARPLLVTPPPTRYWPCRAPPTHQAPPAPRSRSAGRGFLSPVAFQRFG